LASDFGGCMRLKSTQKFIKQKKTTQEWPFNTNA